MRVVTRTVSIVGALALVACSAQAPEVAPRVPATPAARLDPVAPPVTPSPPPAPAVTRFEGELRSDAVAALTENGTPVGNDDVDGALSKQRVAALACLSGSERRIGTVWLVGRISTSGSLEALAVGTSDAPAKRQCVLDAIAKASFSPRPSPRAISISLHFVPDGPPAAPIDTPPEDAPSRDKSARAKPEAAPSQPARRASDPPTPPSASKDAEEFGMFGLLGNAADGSLGGLGSVEPGAAFGAGGAATGSGGGGRGEGIGLGSIGTLGHGAGTGTGQGFGNGHGRLGGAHRSKPPSIRMGATSVSGRLPVEVIQRIVRQNFGRFRLCYEKGLRNEPSLQGLVSVEFTIGRDGSISKVARHKKTDLGDTGVVSCVVRAFSNLSFPEPESGVVKVIYPIMFSPGDDAPQKPTPRKPFTVANKKKVVDVDAATIAGLLENEKQAVEAITLAASSDARAPYVVFVRTGETVSTVRRLKLDAKGAPLLVHGIERVAPDGWALRVEGDTTFVTHEILATLVDP